MRLRGDPAALLVEVANAAAGREEALTGSGTGLGLQGLRERVAACGGTLEAGATPTAAGACARLPRRAAGDAADPPPPAGWGPATEARTR